MMLFEVNIVDVSLEKYVFVIEKIEEGILVKVGEVVYLMEEKYYIMWIEFIVDDKVYRKYLKSGDELKVLFEVLVENVVVYEYCNLYGLWKKE